MQQNLVPLLSSDCLVAQLLRFKHNGVVVPALAQLTAFLRLFSLFFALELSVDEVELVDFFFFLLPAILLPHFWPMSAQNELILGAQILMLSLTLFQGIRPIFRGVFSVELFLEISM